MTAVYKQVNFTGTSALSVNKQTSARIFTPETRAIDANPVIYHSYKNFVIVLSNWNNIHPQQTYANLKKLDGYKDSRISLQLSLTKLVESIEWLRF